MKRFVAAVLVVGILVAVGAEVFAFGPGAGFGPCGINNPQGTAITPEQFNKFQQDVQPLRERLFQLKTELSALMSQPTPDYGAIADKKKQMVDVKVEILKKANEAGIGMGRCGCMGGGLGNPAGFKAGKRGFGPGYRL